MVAEEKLLEAIEKLLEKPKSNLMKTEDINKKIRRNELGFAFLMIDLVLHMLIIFILL